MSYGRHCFPIVVKLKAPFSSAGIGHVIYGHDISLYRNHDNKIALSGDQIRGVMRAALLKLNEEAENEEDQKKTIECVFGKEGDNGRRSLSITDLVLQDSQGNGSDVSPDKSTHSLTRIAIDEQTGAVQQGAMIIYEQVGEIGEILTFKGELSFIGDLAAKQNLLNWGIFALKHEFALGLAKAAGFGKIDDVSLEEACSTIAEINTTDPPTFNHSVKFSMIINEPVMVDPIMVTDNVFKSQPFIPGHILKGALYSQLVQSGLLGAVESVFTHIRISHALPKDTTRLAVPLDTVKISPPDANGVKFKSAFDSDLSGRVTHLSDFKDEDFDALPEHLKPANALSYFVKTRTKVDHQRGQAEDSQLFTYHMLNHLAFEFKMTLLLDEPAEEVKNQFNSILAFIESFGLTGIGKTLAYGKCNISDPVSAPSIPTKAMRLRLTLACDSFLLDGVHANLSDLHKAYETYFKSCFGYDDLALKNFASDEYWRDPPGYNATFLGKLNKKGKATYFPCLMTRAGSVFVLTSEKDLSERANQLLESGLPMAGDNHWEICQLTSDNGYGEFSCEVVS